MTSFPLSWRLYYGLKPYVPWRLRIAARRWSARRRRANHVGTWPIDSAAGSLPASWPGWPEGKRFGLVLTHDVEGAAGLAKTRQLAETEIRLGFRSSFNFVPEGGYAVPPELRQWLAAHRFEVGVHDLKHDGMLFRSRRGFEQSAVRINRYLREWGAAGFRSGFMLRNLDWVHDLDVQYDSSTFDTDPFEPQSDGAGTIFPFWVPSPGRDADRDGSANPTARQRGGYVELPYTLPQDSTLFLVLGETSPEIWMRKLDWVARNGGMAMVNVHPDYIAFGQRRGAREYPVEHYVRFLRYIQDTYRGEFWNATPRETAEYARVHVAAPAVVPSPAVEKPGARILAGKRAAVLLYSRYPSDPRPRRAAEALTDAGVTVDLLCLGTAEAPEPAEQNVRGVNVTRTAIEHNRESRLGYVWQYGRFFLTAFHYLTWKQRRHRYDVIHVHNMPDFLVFATIVQRLRGARVILDLHDPMPELMMSIYGLESQDWKVRLLRALERWSIGFAHLVLTPNKSFRDLFAARTGEASKIQIVMNSPEERIFDPDRFPAESPASRDGAFRIMHHGSILHRHGIDLLVMAVARLRPEIPGLCLDLYGSRAPFLDVVMSTASKFGVDDIVRYHGPKSQEQIAAAIRECSVGVVPNRRSPFTSINFPTRLFEYLSMQRPVIAPATQGIADYFPADSLITFEPENIDDLTAKILWVHRHPEEAQQRVQRGIAIYRQHLWRNEKHHFTSLVAQVLPPAVTDATDPLLRRPAPAGRA